MISSGASPDDREEAFDAIVKKIAKLPLPKAGHDADKEGG